MCTAAVAPAQDLSPDGKPKILEDVRIEQRLNEQIPAELVFRDENDEEVRLGDYYGKKPILLALVYFRCPMMCTEVLNGLADCLKQVPLEMGKDYSVVTVSFDTKDTPEKAEKKKANYLELYGKSGGEEGWHFLTGQQPSIDSITQAAGFHYVFDEKTQQFAHPAGIMVLTPEGRISKYFYGIRYSARDVRLGLVDASDRKIGTPADQVLLYCFHYDPEMGKYTANVMNLVRMSGIFTLLVIAGVLAMMWRHERRRTRPPAPGTEKGP